jgi:SAM-dependent methyltransferase
MMSHPEGFNNPINPQYRSFKYSVRRYYIDTYMTQQAETIPAGMLVLDIGGQKGNTRGQFQIERYPVRPVFLNLIYEKAPDVQADGSQLPFVSGVFDVILCIEVLEHVPHPPDILAEANRALKPGGTLIVTAPFLYRFHSDPYDYGRYTHVYWREQLEAQGFEQVDVTWHGLFWSVAVEFIRQWVAFQHQQGRLKVPGLRGIFARAFGWMRRRALIFDSQLTNLTDSFHSAYTTGYGLRAVKRNVVNPGLKGSTRNRVV